MTLGDKIARSRKEKNFTQEQLAELLGVSRQAISKWESDTAYPETEKLIRLSELFDCSLDYLLKDSVEIPTAEEKREMSLNELLGMFRRTFDEKKSDKTVWGMPLWCIGRNARGFIAVGVNARGVIALGMKARGIVSLGLFSLGVFSYGLLSLGLFSAGIAALGILSAGCFCAGIIAAGAVSFGVVSLGAVAVGDFSIGAAAIGKYFAAGDHARAMIASGTTKAAGEVWQKVGELSTEDITKIEELLDIYVPVYLNWAKNLAKLFL